MARQFTLRQRRRNPILRPRTFVIAAVVALVALLAPTTLRSDGSIALEGLQQGAVLGSDALDDLAVRVVTHGVSGKKLKAEVDGHEVALSTDGPTYVVRLAGLSEGPHKLVVKGSGGLFGGGPEAERGFSVDLTPPELQLRVPSDEVRIGAAVDVSGTVSPGSTVTVRGGDVAVHGEDVSIHFAHPPLGAKVVATDGAGNHTVDELTVPTAYPIAVRGVHMTGYAWTSSKLRKPVLRLVREKRINTIELDIKEEDGIVNFDPGVPLAKRVGSILTKYDPAAVVQQLHAMGVRVMGRIVAFNDPVLGKWAWKHGHRDWVIQTPKHKPYRYGYARSYFTNFGSDVVRRYNIGIAAAAVRAGFDDIVFDYIRRPDGKIKSMRFPGLTGDPEKAVAGFAQDAAAVVHSMGAYVGATIFAQAVLRPSETAQNVPMMAHYLDAVMPMDYPSHWGLGEYGIKNPRKNVYAIVKRSLVDWKKAVRGTHCKVVAWLQDENFRGTYDVATVRREIQGARDNDLPGWVMWSATARYTRAAFSPNAVRVL